MCEKRERTKPHLGLQGSLLRCVRVLRGLDLLFDLSLRRGASRGLGELLLERLLLDVERLCERLLLRVVGCVV